MHLLPLTWKWNEEKTLKVSCNIPKEDSQRAYNEFIEEVGPFNDDLQAITIFSLYAAIPAGHA